MGLNKKELVVIKVLLHAVNSGDMNTVSTMHNTGMLLYIADVVQDELDGKLTIDVLDGEHTYLLN